MPLEATLPQSTASDVKGRILVIDDEADIRESLETLLGLEGYSVDQAQNAAEGLHKLETRGYDMVLLDLMMPDRSGMEVLREVRERDRETPIAMITAYGSVEAAVNALKSGATDYFSKPWDNEKLVIEIERMISQRRLEYENTHLKRALKQRYSFPNIIGKSERMVKMLDLVAQVAPSRSTILINGDTGTGKELVAKAIHANSPRADNLFVAVNSGSLPPELLESTLFGHVKGAFTSAVQSKKGYFEVADHGTIFFDEIGTIGPETQIKLLRVIQEKEFTPLGSTEPIRVDVRILAATNADLFQLVKEGKFREDLYYRLNVISIPLPPLRERKEDIPLLVDHFFTYYCRENNKYLEPTTKRSVLQFQPEAMQVLMEHSWPGNVRELENVVERAVVLATDAAVPIDVLPDPLLEANGVRLHRAEGAPLSADASLFEICNDFERRVILERLEQFNWSQTEAAESLHVPLSTLNQKIKRLDIKIRKKSDSA
ncbi:MAG TPA: sigma-54 dependent transcriptional regulator [Bryobacteraceae bacterium]|jgi:DNA-binding NtrC family response regulator|nr:sigma-54 dependent transcriptional regulator [Bryobacteraceae bacterium]